MTYAEEQAKRASRLADFLMKPGNVDHGLRRDTLARHLSTPTLRISGVAVTALWPMVEARVVAASTSVQPMFPLRPLSRWGYRCAVLSTPHQAAWASIQRERYRVTMMRNDQVGGLDEHLRDFGHLLDRDDEYEVRQRLERRDDYLGNWSRHLAAVESAEARLVAHIVGLPDIAL